MGACINCIIETFVFKKGKDTFTKNNEDLNLLEIPVKGLKGEKYENFG